MLSTEATAETRRELEICNACRYCEGYCAVFPAMELSREFSNGDMGYLANLCHDCRGCFYSCQYTPPHEFAINLPKAFAELRAATYAEHAWPRGSGKLFERSGTVVALATASGIAVVLLVAALIRTATATAEPRMHADSFYAVIPESAMIGVALIATLFSLAATCTGVARFWKESGATGAVTLRALVTALRDMLTLRNLGGGGYGCNDRGERFSLTRRRFHHALFYGFLLCFASTVVAAVYDHLLGRLAPYPLVSMPVVLGTAGGVGMTIGATGLLWLKVVGDGEPTARKLLGGGYALLVQLLLASVTGLLLLALRDTAAMGILLAVHLGVIFSFFVTAPYSMFVHGSYRTAALLRNALESNDSLNS